MMWKFFVDHKAWNASYDLYIRRDSPDGTRAFVPSIPLTVIERGLPSPAAISEYSLESQDGLGDVTGFLQGALEAAWEMGLRPKGLGDHTNELKAVRYHLEDMRLLAKVRS